MNVMKRLSQVILFFALFTTVTPAILFAQTSNGTIAGSVVDPKNNIVPKANIKAISPQFGAVHEIQTDSAGTYRLESLQPGIYNVTISASGFTPLRVSGVVVNGSVTTTVNGKLQLAAAQNLIEVTAPASQVIDTQSGQMGETLNTQEVKELPYFSLNPAELAFTLPGVHDTPQGHGAVNTAFTDGVEFSVNGTRPRANNFLIDGQDDNDYGVTGQAFQPGNVGAIKEVTILANAYSAEFGRGGGSVTNYIYKSGTNNFHGDLWEINRNSALAAIPAQLELASPVTKNPYDNENTFGFDVGGPIKKDKLFFFGTAQWDRERQSVTGPLFRMPTAAGVATLKANFSSNANVNLFLNSIGSLVSPGVSGLESIATTLATPSNLNGCPCVQAGYFQVQNVPTASNALDWNYRMDWQFSDKDTLTGSVLRYTSTLSPDNFANPNALPNFQTQQGGPTDIFRGQWVHTISPTWVNELRLSYISINFGFNLTPATAANPLVNTPFISFGSVSTTDTSANFPSIGVDSGFPQGRAHHTWQVQDSLSHTVGKHSLKVGVDVTILSVDDTLALNTRGSIIYNSGGSYTALGNFILDQTGQNPGTVSKGFGNPNLNTSANMFALYAEDTWRVKNNLTLTAGLRYEYWGAMANALKFPSFNTSVGVGLPNIDSSYADPSNPAKFDSLFSYKQVPDKTNFAPRIGLAYTPHLFGDAKTTFRAGYGIFYDGLFSNIVDNSASSQPNTFGGTYTGLTGIGVPSASTFPGIAPTLNSSLFLESMASNLHNPLTQQWNVDAQRELPLGLVMTLAYVGTRGQHLFTNQDFNPQVNYSYTNPNFGEIGIRTNGADSWYNSGQFELERQIHTLVFRAAYTYSRFLDDSSEVFSTTGTSSYSQILTNQRSDWGPSAFDQRHRFTVAYVWEVPYSHYNTLVRILTDRWQWSGIATLESGGPNTVEVGFDNIGNGHANSRPSLGNPFAPLNSFAYDGNDILGTNVGPYGYAPGSTPLYYEFNCINAWYGGGPQCPAEPANYFHFIVPNSVPGNVGRNSLFGPGQIYFDTSIQRDFPIHFWKLENHTLKFRAELFNAFNHPNLFTPSYTMTDPNFNNTAITINGGRQIKLWLKYEF